MILILILHPSFYGYSLSSAFIIFSVSKSKHYSGNLGWYQLNQQAGLAPPAATIRRNADTKLNIFI
jgi:hypothetical protein